MARFRVRAEHLDSGMEAFIHTVTARDRNAAIGLAVYEVNKTFRDDPRITPLQRSKLKFNVKKA